MEYAFTIITFIFALVLLLFAWLVYRGNTELIRTFNFVKVKDKKDYARFLGRSLAKLAAVPAVGGLLGLFIRTAAAAIAMLALFVVAIIVFAKQAKDYYA